MGYLGFILLGGVSSLLGGLGMVFGFGLSNSAMSMEAFAGTYPFTVLAASTGLTASVQLFLAPRFCLPWWKDDDWAVFGSGGRLPKYGVAFVLFTLNFLAFAMFPQGAWSGAGAVRFVMFWVCFTLAAMAVVVCLKPRWIVNKSKKGGDSVKSSQSMAVNLDALGSGRAVQDDSRPSREFNGEEWVLRGAESTTSRVNADDVEAQIRAAFPDNSFKEELMLKAHGNIKELYTICDEIETFNSVADDNLRKVVEIMENMFNIILEEPDRLNDMARNTLTVFLEKVVRIGKNLHLLLHMGSREDEKYQRVQEVFIEFERILNIRRDTLYASEMSQLDTDLSMLEDEVASIAAREKLQSAMDA